MNAYKNIIDVLTKAFESLEQKLTPPTKKKFGSGYVYRYEDKSFQQAVIQKLARTLTGLKALLLLNENALFQEQAILQRVLDELEEDVMFLTFSYLFNDQTDLHYKFLNAFYEEEFDNPKNAIDSSQKRPMIPRQKIRAYINKDRGTGFDQSISIEISRTLNKIYSGYVHCASPQVMELYYGIPPKFQISGELKSPFYNDHKEDLFNNFFRAIHSFFYASKMFGQYHLFNYLFDYSREFAIKCGKDYNVM